MIRFGTEYGGYLLPENNDLNSESIIYSLGVGEDISFDTTITGKYNCKVFMFDPTPRSIEHVDKIKNVLCGKEELIYNKRFGGGQSNYIDIIKNSNCNPNNLIFEPIGIYNKNSFLDFYFPNNEEYVSCSLETFGRNSNKSMKVQVKTIETIMKENNHSNIDVLKIDIENSEYDVLMNMFDCNIYPRFICIDFDGLRNNFLSDEKKVSILEHILQKYSVLVNNNYDFTFKLK
jgi:FkbM family methyltransferase